MGNCCTRRNEEPFNMLHRLDFEGDIHQDMKISVEEELQGSDLLDVSCISAGTKNNISMIDDLVQPRSSKFAKQLEIATEENLITDTGKTPKMKEQRSANTNISTGNLNTSSSQLEFSFSNIEQIESSPDNNFNSLRLRNHSVESAKRLPNFTSFGNNFISDIDNESFNSNHKKMIQGLQSDGSYDFTIRIKPQTLSISKIMNNSTVFYQIFNHSLYKPFLKVNSNNEFDGTIFPIKRMCDSDSSKDEILLDFGTDKEILINISSDNKHSATFITFDLYTKTQSGKPYLIAQSIIYYEMFITSLNMMPRNQVSVPMTSIVTFEINYIVLGNFNFEVIMESNRLYNNKLSHPFDFHEILKGDLRHYLNQSTGVTYAKSRVVVGHILLFFQDQHCIKSLSQGNISKSIELFSLEDYDSLRAKFTKIITEFAQITKEDTLLLLYNELTNNVGVLSNLMSGNLKVETKTQSKYLLSHSNVDSLKLFVFLQTISSILKSDLEENKRLTKKLIKEKFFKEKIITSYFESPKNQPEGLDSILFLAYIDLLLSLIGSNCNPLEGFFLLDFMYGKFKLFLQDFFTGLSSSIKSKSKNVLSTQICFEALNKYFILLKEVFQRKILMMQADNESKDKKSMIEMCKNDCERGKSIIYNYSEKLSDLLIEHNNIDESQLSLDANSSICLLCINFMTFTQSWIILSKEVAQNTKISKSDFYVDYLVKSTVVRLSTEKTKGDKLIYNNLFGMIIVMLTKYSATLSPIFNAVLIEIMLEITLESNFLQLYNLMKLIPVTYFEKIVNYELTSLNKKRSQSFFNVLSVLSKIIKLIFVSNIKYCSFVCISGPKTTLIIYVTLIDNVILMTSRRLFDTMTDSKKEFLKLSQTNKPLFRIFARVFELITTFISNYTFEAEYDKSKENKFVKAKCKSIQTYSMQTIKFLLTFEVNDFDLTNNTSKSIMYNLAKFLKRLKSGEAPELITEVFNDIKPNLAQHYAKAKNILSMFD